MDGSRENGWSFRFGNVMAHLAKIALGIAFMLVLFFVANKLAALAGDSESQSGVFRSRARDSNVDRQKEQVGPPRTGSV